MCLSVKSAKSAVKISFMLFLGLRAKPAPSDPWFHTAIQWPNPAVEQPNPTATELGHDKKCDSSVALVANAVECERLR